MDKVEEYLLEEGARVTETVKKDEDQERSIRNKRRWRKTEVEQGGQIEEQNRKYNSQVARNKATTFTPLTSGFFKSRYLYNAKTITKVSRAAHQLIRNIIATHRRDPTKDTHML